MTVIEVAIELGGAPGVFRVEVVESPAGEASETVELDADSLLARRGQLQQAVLASAVPSRRVLPETERTVREVGQMLFTGLLGTGEVAGRYRASAAIAAEREQGLRVVLRINSPALAGLPWEAMYDQAAGVYVCRQGQLVRHIPIGSVPTPLQVRPPLRILGVVSSPRGLLALDVEKEQDQLARALDQPARQGLAELCWAPSATWADLQALLLGGEWHVMHFIGHGDFDPGQDEGVLALVREDGRANLVAAHRLVDLLHLARPMPRLVVLNSCSGAATGASDLFSGTAAALVRGGVSAVAAMQYEISDPAAVAFTHGFYAAIACGRGVDDAVSSGRVAILGISDRTLEWVTPVLYLRGRNSQLFTLPAPAVDPLSRRTFELTEQGQVTDRYAKAIEQLGSEKLDVRIGGIYALERVARDSARDYPAVMEVLTAFIREHSREQWPLPDPDGQEQGRSTRPDIRAAVTVVRRRDQKRDIQPIDLTGAFLVGADLTGTTLSRANLSDVNLGQADLTHADLTQADLRGANLTRADLTGTTLSRANLSDVNLGQADLTHADLTHADLTHADLTQADLRGANLTRADLTGTTLPSIGLEFFGKPVGPNLLTGANFSHADLTRADLRGADLTRADLTGAKWPEDTPVPEGWKLDTGSGRLIRGAH